MNEEMIGKLKEAKSVEDVVAIAKEYGKDLAVEQAKASCPTTPWALSPGGPAGASSTMPILASPIHTLELALWAALFTLR